MRAQGRLHRRPLASPVVSGASPNGRPGRRLRVSGHGAVTPLVGGVVAGALGWARVWVRVWVWIPFCFFDVNLVELRQTLNLLALRIHNTYSTRPSVAPQQARYTRIRPPPLCRHRGSTVRRPPPPCVRAWLDRRARRAQ